MGVYDDDSVDDKPDVEAEFAKRQDIGRYLAYHARKQLAFDLWWLVLAVFISQ
jgi:hypothetical protein